MAGVMHGREGACMAGGMCVRGACVAGWHAWQGGMHCREVCVAGGHVWHARPSRYMYYEIRSMSGRYASYWNAFLFENVHTFFYYDNMFHCK